MRQGTVTLPNSKITALTSISTSTLAEPCPPLKDRTNITIGEGFSAWQFDRQQYVECANSKAALAQAIATKEKAIEQNRQVK